MDPVAQDFEREQLEQLERPQLNALGKLTAIFAQFGQNAVNNMSSSVNGMSAQGWLRLVIIVGGYMLLRPYLMKIVTKGAVKKMEEDDAREKAAISPNQLRGKVDIPGVDDEDELAGDGSGTNWGSKARLRQRHFLKTMLEAEERQKQEDDDDKDIEDLLED